MLPSFPMDITNEGQKEGGGVGKREEKVSTQTKSPLSPLISFCVFFLPKWLEAQNSGNLFLPPVDLSV